MKLAFVFSSKLSSSLTSTTATLSYSVSLHRHYNPILSRCDVISGKLHKSPSSCISSTLKHLPHIWHPWLRLVVFPILEGFDCQREGILPYFAQTGSLEIVLSR